MDQDILRVFSFLLNAQEGAEPPAVAGEVWEAVVPLANHHMLAPRLSRYLEGRDSGLSAGARGSLMNSRLNAHRVHALAERQIFSLEKVFVSSGIPLVHLKGWTFAARHYENPLDRTFGDIDVLLPEGADRRAAEILGEMGYEPDVNEKKFSANRHKTTFKPKSGPGLPVECHFGLGQDEFNWGCVTQTRLKVLGSDLLINHLDEKREFAFLLRHAVIQHRCQKLIWLLDLKKLMATATTGLDAGPSRIMRNAFQNLNEALADFNGVSGRSTGVWPAIATGRIEKSPWLKAKARARFMGGWVPLARYSLARLLAR